MTMVVQHLENRLALSSVHPNEQLHEFQIVHALITQCRKQVSYEDSDCNGCECPSPTRDLKDKGLGIDRSDKTSFVHTIRQTFNALAQATSPSLCTKQNVAHPVSIASTVKNIISQFSRQACHGSIYSASQCKETDLKLDTPQGKAVKRPGLSTQINRHNYKQNEDENVFEPSTSHEPILERTQVKCATVVKQKLNTIPVAAKPNTRVERARNGNGLVRHESAPPLLNQCRLKSVKKTTSVKRSKSDAVCYQTHSKRNRRKIDSNVQTKVLHFEKCCEESMCIECRRRSLDEELNTTPKPVSSLITSRADTIIPKQESFMGALSYHKPSIISQNASSSASAANSSDDTFISPPTDNLKSGSPTAVKPKAVMCPGGTYFPCEAFTDDQSFPKRNDASFENDAPTTKDDRLDIELQENNCSYAKTTDLHLNIKNEESNKKSICVLEDMNVSHGAGCDAVEKTISIVNIDTNVTISSFTENQLACNNENNLYTRLCSVERVDSLEATELSFTIDSDSSDNVDSGSSSSNESSISPRQDYIDRRNGLITSARPAPSARYKRIRRKLKKLITRSRSCSEAVQQEVFLTQAEREQEFLLSLRIPTPTFMLPEGNASFDVKRQQLAMHFEKNKDYMKRLPDHVLVQMFSHLDTRSLAMLKCVCVDFNFLINSYDIRGIDSLWVKDVRYMEDPCRFCRKKFSMGDVSMCRYHAKYYHCDLPYGRSYWMCCFKLEKNAPGCKTGIHDNRWALFQQTSNQ